MELEKRHGEIDPDPEPYEESPHHYLDYIHPLEEVDMGRYTNFQYVQVPTEQGRLLLEFIRRHIFNGDIEK